MQDTEIDVTPIFASPGFNPWDCSNSVANLGNQAGRLTWEASKQSAHLLTLSPSARSLAEIRPQVVRHYQPAVIKKG